MDHGKAVGQTWGCVGGDVETVGSIRLVSDEGLDEGVVSPTLINFEFGVALAGEDQVAGAVVALVDSEPFAIAADAVAGSEEGQAVEVPTARIGFVLVNALGLFGEVDEAVLVVGDHTLGHAYGDIFDVAHLGDGDAAPGAGEQVLADGAAALRLIEDEDGAVGGAFVEGKAVGVTLDIVSGRVLIGQDRDGVAPRVVGIDAQHGKLAGLSQVAGDDVDGVIAELEAVAEVDVVERGVEVDVLDLFAGEVEDVDAGVLVGEEHEALGSISGVDPDGGIVGVGAALERTELGIDGDGGLGADHGCCAAQAQERREQ
ncbi:MAG: hypothetical protein A2Z14_16110 [Chloroflexi bacterium RBG_16_48_8]|nr:MAG: hypothetical protein A2Z14_16110 [Chloroflexi bacterium RBG_16_48_8]